MSSLSEALTGGKGDVHLFNIDCLDTKSGMIQKLEKILKRLGADASDQSNAGLEDACH